MPGSIRSGARVCLWLALIVGVLVGLVGNPAGTRAAESEATIVPLLWRIPAIGDGLQEATPFLRDTELSVHPRTHYFYQQNTDGTINQAWAGGGWLEYKSGWFWDTAQIGATLFGTGPIFAPSNEGEYSWPVTPDLSLILGAQYTDQRAVGQDLLNGTMFTQWVTGVGGGRVRLTYRGATLKTTFSLTGPGNTIQNPYGHYPGFIAQIINDFYRANETAWLVGLAYDFKLNYEFNLL